MEREDSQDKDMDARIEAWMLEWVDRTSEKKYENSFEEHSEEWLEIEGIGRFKGLKITSHQPSIVKVGSNDGEITSKAEKKNEIIISLQYEEWNR